MENHITRCDQESSFRNMQLNSPHPAAPLRHLNYPRQLSLNLTRLLYWIGGRSDCFTGWMWMAWQAYSQRDIRGASLASIRRGCCYLSTLSNWTMSMTASSSTLSSRSSGALPPPMLCWWWLCNNGDGLCIMLMIVFRKNLLWEKCFRGELL